MTSLFHCKFYSLLNQLIALSSANVRHKNSGPLAEPPKCYEDKFANSKAITIKATPKMIVNRFKTASNPRAFFLLPNIASPPPVKLLALFPLEGCATTTRISKKAIIIRMVNNILYKRYPSVLMS